MEQVQFGAYLRHARERSGMTVMQVAERLRLKPEIITAIEDSDFDRMPPRTYAKSMVAAYARLFDLNDAEFVNLYLDEADDYDRGYGSYGAPSERYGRRPGESRDYGRRSEPPAYSSRFSVGSAEDYDINNYGGRRSSSPARRKRESNREPIRRNEVRDDYDEGDAYDDEPYEDIDRSNPVLGFVSSIGGRVSDFVQDRKNGDSEGFDLQSKLPIIGGAVAALVVVILLITLLGHGCSKKDAANETMPVTAVEQQDAETEKAPTSFKFEYVIDEGTEAWVEIYIDGEQQMAEQVTGEATGSYDITGELEFVCGSSEGVHVKIDGKEQKLEENENGLIDVTYDYDKMLAKWEEEHGVKATPKNDASAKSDSKSDEDNSSDSQATEGESSTTDTNDATDNQESAESQPVGEQVVNDTTYEDTSDDSGYYEEPVTEDYSDGTATTGEY